MITFFLAYGIAAFTITLCVALVLLVTTIRNRWADRRFVLFTGQNQQLAVNQKFENSIGSLWRQVEQLHAQAATFDSKLHANVELLTSRIARLETASALQQYYKKPKKVRRTKTR